MEIIIIKKTDQKYNRHFFFFLLENHREYFVAAQLIMHFCADPSSFSVMFCLLEWLSMCAWSMSEIRTAPSLHLLSGAASWASLLAGSKDAVSLSTENKMTSPAGTTDPIIFFHCTPIAVIISPTANKRAVWSHVFM